MSIILVLNFLVFRIGNRLDFISQILPVIGACGRNVQDWEAGLFQDRVFLGIPLLGGFSSVGVTIQFDN